MPPREADLGEAELEVLKVLWDEGPLPVREVMNRLHGRGRRVAYTTVLTFLTRLEQKGFVKADKSEMAYIYQPTVSRDGVAKSRLRSFLQQLYDGAAGPLVLQLIREESFTEDEIAQLQKLLDDLDVVKEDVGRAAKKKKGRRQG
jgi:predicted transcriptional regulator